MPPIARDKVAVLIPVYNEEAHVGVFVDDLKKQGLRILAVDDGSTDRSSEVLREKGVETLTIRPNAGKGNALRKGFQRLVSQGFEWVIVMDSDGQHLAPEIAVFLEAASRAPGAIVNGNRMHNPKGMPFIRLVTNKVMSRIVSAASGRRILDSQCGFKMLPAEFLKQAKLTSNRFEIEDEILLEAARLGYPIVFAPVSSVYAGETSHIRPVPDTIRFFRFVFAWMRHRKRG